MGSSITIASEKLSNLVKVSQWGSDRAKFWTHGCLPPKWRNNINWVEFWRLHTCGMKERKAWRHRKDVCTGDGKMSGCHFWRQGKMSSNQRNLILWTGTDLQVPTSHLQVSPDEEACGNGPGETGGVLGIRVRVIESSSAASGLTVSVEVRLSSPLLAFGKANTSSEQRLLPSVPEGQSQYQIWWRNRLDLSGYLLNFLLSHHSLWPKITPRLKLLSHSCLQSWVNSQTSCCSSLVQLWVGPMPWEVRGWQEENPGSAAHPAYLLEHRASGCPQFLKFLPSPLMLWLATFPKYLIFENRLLLISSNFLLSPHCQKYAKSRKYSC